MQNKKTIGKLSNVLIVGLGLIGGSMAMSMRSCGYKNIRAIDINRATIDFAIEKNIIDVYEMQQSELIAWADIVILALYPFQVADFLKCNQEYLQSDSLIIDTSGIKSNLIKNVRSFLRKDVDFLAIHQMAGKEQGGIANASADLFKNSNFILIKQNENSKKNLIYLEELASDLMVKGICTLTAAEHDEVIAYTSHLPHVIAVSLINSISFNNLTHKFTGGSFRDATRVALINASLWSQLLIDNKSCVTKELDELANQLARIKSALEKDSYKELEMILEQARVNRSKL